MAADKGYKILYFCNLIKSVTKKVVTSITGFCSYKFQSCSYKPFFGLLIFILLIISKLHGNTKTQFFRVKFNAPLCYRF